MLLLMIQELHMQSCMCEVNCAVIVYALVGRTRTKLKLKLIALDHCVPNARKT